MYVKGSSIKRLSYLDRQRLIRTQRKREKRRLKRKYRPKTSSKRIDGNLYVKPILASFYAKKLKLERVKRKKKVRQLYFPSRFSLYEEPDEVLKVYEDLVSYGLNEHTEHIRIEQGHCTVIDHGAESVLNALGISVSRTNQIRFSGMFPDDAELEEIVRATGLPKALGVKMPEPSGFLTFPLREGLRQTPRVDRSGSSEIAATELADYINQCLLSYKYKLGVKSEKWLFNLIGEVLKNAEEHGGQPFWYIAGYLRQRSNQQYGDCHISIFNFGDTLFETMQRLPPTHTTRAAIEKLVQEHSSQGFLRRDVWSEENLWTLYALQEGVTSKWDDEDPDRGTGTADMIEFFQKLGSTDDSSAYPRMCVISGHTQILFDGKYQLQEMEVEHGERRRIIAFNDSNDLRDPPDPKAVRRIKRFFPGTLITIDFYLDPANLERIQETVCLRS